MVEKYTGTKGLNCHIAINRIKELFQKYKLNSKDEEFLEESINFLELNFPLIDINSQNWVFIKDKLTAKQLLYLLEKQQNGKR